MNKHHLADLQLAIMQVLWYLGEATVAEVRSELAPQRKLAHTTIGTMLTKLVEKGVVSFRSDGRANIYRAKVSQDRVSRSMVTDLAKRLFGGDITQMMCHALDGQSVSRDELAELKKLIRAKEKELNDDA